MRIFSRKFEWHIQHTATVNDLIKQNDLCFGTVDAWLLWNLTNGGSFKTDVTNASRTMLFNINNLRYDARCVTYLVSQ